MMTQLKFQVPFALILLLLLNACGVVTRARYGNGLKLNIESQLFARKDKSTPNIPEKRSRRKIPTKPLDSAHHLPDVKHMASDFKLDVLENSRTLNNTPISLKPQHRSIRHTITSVFKDGKKIKSYHSVSTSEKRKTEPTVAAGAWLFFGSIAANAYIIYSTLSFPPFVFILLFLTFLTGMILACIGLHKIKKSQNTYKGKALAISIIVLFLLSLLSFLMILAVLAVVF